MSLGVFVTYVLERTISSSTAEMRPFSLVLGSFHESGPVLGDRPRFAAATIKEPGWVLHRSRFSLRTRCEPRTSRAPFETHAGIFEFDEIRLLTTHLNCHTVLCQLIYGLPD